MDAPTTQTASEVRQQQPLPNINELIFPMNDFLTFPFMNSFFGT